MNRPGQPRKAGSVGTALPDQEVRIIAEQGTAAGAGAVGEIVMRGRHVMKGYYKNPEATAETLKEGWLYTGDLGFSDAEGFFFITGRKKESIIRGGANVYSKEVEVVLNEHPAVKESAVIGLPDTIWGEEVAAAVILKDGSAAAAEEIIEHAKKSLADYKCPKFIFFMEELPKTASGSIQKGLLLERVIERRAGEGL
jgi:long-chain acyl-CoA synthetase